MSSVHPAAGHMRPRFVRLCLALAAAVAFAAAVPAAALPGASDINPNSSDLDASDPDGASGGRMNGLGADPNNNQVFYGATEWGGIYKSTNGGLSWSHLDNHTPFATWDVAVDPANSQRVYATSFFDGRITSGTRAGINVSSNAVRAGRTPRQRRRPRTRRPTAVSQLGGTSQRPLGSRSSLERRRTSTWGRAADWQSRPTPAEPGASLIRSG
jgi:hypothetical protein